jgi:pimeloyl-ACP methyl ester carboxylesterase
MSLYVDETGTRGAPTIIFMHGVGASGWMWWKQIVDLKEFHCLNVDLPGHGKSNHVTWVSVADTAEHIAAIIQDRALNKQAHVVGLSLGGHVALALLEHHAEVLDRVVISGVTAAPMPNRIFLNPQLWLMTALFKWRWYVNMQARALHLPPQQEAAFTENLLAMSMPAYRRIWEEVVDFSVPSILRRVNTPTLITAGGTEAKIITQAVEVISSMMPNAQGRIAPGFGHGWNIEAPELFTTMVRAWISDDPLPKALQVASRLSSLSSSS